jgi:hypothetical protein
VSDAQDASASEAWSKQKMRVQVQVGPFLMAPPGVEPGSFLSKRELAQRFARERREGRVSVRGLEQTKDAGSSPGGAIPNGSAWS